MAEVEIPDKFLDEFKTVANGVENPMPGVGSEMAIQSLEESLGWITRQADNYMKNEGLTGFGEIGADEFAKLTAALARKRFPDFLTSNSIEAVWCIAAAGIIGINITDYQEKQKESGGSDDEND